jgi:hypothetical protein
VKRAVAEPAAADAGALAESITAAVSPDASLDSARHLIDARQISDVISASELTGEGSTSLLVFAGDEDLRAFANSQSGSGGGYPGRAGDQANLVL